MNFRQINRRTFVGSAFAAALTLTAPAAAQTVNSQKQAFRPVVVTSGLEHPWALAFLPDGRMLVTERAGRLRVIADGQLQREAISDVPKVVARGQGGLLDVVLHPDYASNGLFYVNYTARSGATVIARYRFRAIRTSPTRGPP